MVANCNCQLGCVRKYFSEHTWGTSVIEFPETERKDGCTEGDTIPWAEGPGNEKEMSASFNSLLTVLSR